MPAMWPRCRLPDRSRPTSTPGRTTRRSAQPHRHRRPLVEERRAHALAVAVGLHLREAAQRLFDPQLQLEPRKAGSQAEVATAAAEALVRVGFAAHVEVLRILEDALVAIA